MRGLAVAEGLLGLLPTSLVYLVELPFGLAHALLDLPESWRMYGPPTDFEIALVLAMATGAVSLPAFWYLVWLRWRGSAAKARGITPIALAGLGAARAPADLMSLHWREAFSFPFRDPGWKPKLFMGGLVLLLCPPVGWPLALGYRREAALRLRAGQRPVLPGWSGTWRSRYRLGLAAAGVILAYYAPFLCLYSALAFPGPAELAGHLHEIAWFFVLIAVLIPLFLPLLPPLYWVLFPWVQLSSAEQWLIGVVFWGTAFLLPAAFARVSLTGRFRSALRVREVVGFIVRHPAPYLEAWVLSLCATALAIGSGPLAPWGIFWSYLAILHAFTEALVLGAAPEVVTAFADSSLLRLSRLALRGSRDRRPGLRSGEES